MIVTPGKIARFDIGFIGPGNSEISKDKLSRYGNMFEAVDGAKSSSTTFIVVDRLPETGKTKAAASKIGAEIIQMSMQFWPRELATKLHERFGYEHELIKFSDHDLQAYLKSNVEKVQVQEFLSNITVDEIDDDNTAPHDSVEDDDDAV